MIAGKLDKRAQFALKTMGSADAYGERVPSWSETSARWVDLRPINPKSAEFAKGFAETVTHTAYIRQWDEVTSSCRFKIGDRTFYIDGVVHSTDGTMTTLYCTEEL